MMTETPDQLPLRPGDLAPFMAGQWLVEPSLNRADREGQQVQLQPRIMHVLVCLAARAGKVVTREELLDTVWQDAVVCEDALTRTISELRRLFEDDRQQPRFIETIRKGGYRLLVPVTPADATEPAAAAAPARPADMPPAARTSEARHSPSRRRGLAALGLVCAAAVVAVLFFWIQGAYTAAPEQPQILRTMPFSSYSGSEADPAVSPDGTRVAFVWDGGEGKSFDLYVKQRDTETPLRLTEGEESVRFPAWSPDGATIAFTSRRDGRWGIFTVPAIGGPERRLTYSEARLTGLDWSPDGSLLAYSFGYWEGHQPCIMLFDPASGESRAITDPLPPNMCDHKPAFSPDGRQVAFLRYGGSFHEDIHLVPVAGGEVTALTERQRWVTGFDWTADGTQVIFSAAPDGRYRLWRVPAAGGPVTWLSTSGEMVQKPSLARNAHCLVFEQLSCDYDIWSVRDTGGDGPCPAPAPLITSTRMDYSPHISPDGRSVVFLSDRSGSREVWVCDGEGCHPRQLTRFGDRFLANPRWSPDGRRIAFSSNPDEEAAVCILDPATGETRRIGDPEQYAWFCDWSPDGQWVYFSSDRSGDHQIWRMKPDGTDAGQVTRDGGRRARVSPDGRSLWYGKLGQAGIWQVDLESGEERCAIEPPGGVAWASWEPSAGAIHYVEARTEDYLLARYDLSTGKSRPLALIPSHSNPSLAVSADGATILYGHADRVERDLVMAVDSF